MNGPAAAAQGGEGAGGRDLRLASPRPAGQSGRPVVAQKRSAAHERLAAVLVDAHAVPIIICLGYLPTVS